MIEFFDSVSHYENVKTPDQYQFFVSKGDEVRIFSENEEQALLERLNKKFKGFKTIVHSAYILSNLQKPWQRKMLLQEFDIAGHIKAKYFVFHLHESNLLYDNIDALIQSDKLSTDKYNCSFAFEISSRRLENPRDYLKQLVSYKKRGFSVVFDVAHVVSSGLYKVVAESKRKGKSPRSEAKHNITRVIKFVQKYGKHFDVLHFADQATQFDSGKDIHALPFAGGSLFQFDNIFTSIDLIDILIQQYSLVVIEFIDKTRTFRRALIRYIENDLFITKEHLHYYKRILNWYGNRLEESYSDDEGITYQLSTYQAIAAQISDICKQTDARIKMNSPLWNKYALSHKVAQLLLVVELTSYFFINSIKPPWDSQPRLMEQESKEVPRSLVDKYIKKFISLKVIKSKKQVFGSYLRGNQTIGDLDVLINAKDKEKVLNILVKAIKGNQYDRNNRQFQDDLSTPLNREYTIVRLYLDNQLNVDLYFAALPNPVTELFLTGNKYFNIFMRKRAATLGFKLTNTKLLNYKQDGTWVSVAVKTQADIFKKLKMKPVPPQFRVFLTDPQNTYTL